MKTLNLPALSLFLAAAATVPVEAGLVRGPYLQMANSSAMTVRWRTDAAGQGMVRFGTAAGNLAESVTGVAGAVNHEIRLTGLSPATTYYYSVEVDGVVLSGGADYHFKTPPVTGATAPFRFWALGDAGTNNFNQVVVRNSLLTAYSTLHPDLMLMLGDNAYASGTDPEYQAAVFNMYPTLLREFCLWSCLGNHETYSNPAAPPYFDIFTFPTAGECGGVASGTEHYYSFDYGNVHFIVLDAMQSSRLATGAQAQWLRADLQAVTVPWTVALWHHPPYTKGSHNSDAEGDLIEVRTQMLPIIEAAGVDLVLCGHSHVYERSWLMKGHYGMSGTFSAATHKVQEGNGQEDGDGVYQKYVDGEKAGKGTVYVVCGCSGAAAGSVGFLPAMATSQAPALGSMIVDVADKRMDVRFLRYQGHFSDHFTLVKTSSGPSVLPGQPAELAALPLDGGKVLLRWDDVVAEASYSVERSVDGLVFTPAGTTVADVTSLEIGGLTTGVPVWLRVTARNINGAATSEALQTYFVPPLIPPTPLEAWRFAYFSTTAQTPLAADGADPDGDGRVNLMEYAVASDPRKGNAEPVLAGAYSPDDEALSLSFPRQLRPDLTYTVQATASLAAGDWESIFTSTGVQNVEGLVTVIDDGAAGAVRRFARLRVTRP